MKPTFVMLIAAALVTGPALGADHEVMIRGMAFQPASLSVSPGDTVTLVNAEGAAHTATARGGGFDTGRLKRDQSATIRIAAAGSLSYFCKLHPAMKGRIAAR
ncbi:Amicyanin [Defluviimonas aquaemixtae]|uniref:Amicyanin n=1 Tax=Albidovulum aquaemixtae TaxID=1542388 RepID=A0A2R8B1P9_9RHOB|nr:cupredoxin family copper-binding protein [Defluviimonas aquaemixtae]SPH16549.1 Amicyanin [Defluviimonas aquaemixtae]